MRQLEGAQKIVIDWTATGFALLFVYAVTFTLPFYFALPLYICLNYVLVFCLYPASNKSPSNRFTFLDSLLCAAIIIVTLYFFHEYDFYVEKAGIFRPQDVFMGSVALVLTFEACRRVLGWSLPILAIAGLIYVLWGSFIPGILGHRGFPYDRVISQVFSFDGIYGTVTAVYSTYVMLFVIFGGVIQSVGMGGFLLDLSNGLVGRLKGGTAKTAVISSATVGTVMGSGAANVAVTGSFTIPLMKKVGYPPHIAGAIETVASAGGVLMPPIMGSAAFLLATFTNTPYRDVALLSFLPAILFYWGIYIQVHFISYKYHIPLIPEGSAPAVRRVLKVSGHMLVPIIVIFVLIFVGYTPYRAAIWAIAVTIALSTLRPLTGKRMSWKEMLLMFGEGAKLQLSVGASAGIIGVIIAALVLPGLPLKIASFAVKISQGNLLLMLFMMMITSYVFGMGIPMVAAYIILAIIAVPALIQIGLPLFTSHLIIMWYSLAALWTPPVCVGAFVASGIAHASPNKIGWYACRLGIGLYIIPLLMAFGMIIHGSIPDILFAAFCVAMGLYCFAASAEGYTQKRLKPWQRYAYLAAAVLLIFPTTGLRLVGIGSFLALFLFAHRFSWARIRARKEELDS
jgi:TRAP transporter 4TM/12TM fusion protein